MATNSTPPKSPRRSKKTKQSKQPSKTPKIDKSQKEPEVPEPEVPEPEIPEPVESPEPEPSESPELPKIPETPTPVEEPEIPPSPIEPEIPEDPEYFAQHDLRDETPQMSIEEADRLVSNAEIAYRLNWSWADFQLYIISPVMLPNTPAVIIPPEPLLDGPGLEFVYPIYDYGFKLATSKAEDMFSSGMSMCKLYFTIEKMIYLLIERLKAKGIGMETEVQVAFAGFILAQRKGFESIINLNYNVAITNFDPGEWGEQYLDTMKRLADKGYGYPEASPRESFRHSLSKTVGPKR